MPCFSQQAQLTLTGTGASQRLIVQDPGSGRYDSIVIRAGAEIGAGDITTTALGPMRAIQFEGTTRGIDQATLTRLAEAAGSGGGSAVTWLDGNGFYGNLVTLEMVDLGARQILAVSRPGGSGFSTFSYNSNGSLTPLQNFPDTGNTSLHGIADMASAVSGGQHWLITASMGENSLSLFRIDTDGRLNLHGSFGFADRLPVNRPALLETVDRGDTSLILLGSQGTSSLTVMALDDTGRLRFVDQVNDTRDTRFDGTSAMDVIRVNGHDLVAVAGGDGGVTLYQLLPSGRLLHRETLIDTLDMALDGVTDLQFVQTGAGLELWVMATRDNGLTRLALDADSLGFRPAGSDGTAATDVLVATSSGGTLRGHAGDDILLDGLGADTLIGGAGSDLFVFRPDGRLDMVTDFDPRSDKLDLSAFPLVHGINDISVRAISGGAMLRIRGEDLQINTANGAQLTAAQLAPALVFRSDHVFMPDPLPQTGTRGNDTFEAGPLPDTIDGGDGRDMVTYHRAPNAIVVDLGNSDLNAGAAAGYVLLNIEGVTGSEFNDRLSGNDRPNLLMGLGGNDVLLGLGGGDWITPGTGSDTIDGGAGTDMASFIDHPARVVADLTEGTVRTGSDINQIRNVENITGTIHSDYLRGDAGANLLRGMGGYDWFVGTDGADTIDGSNGRDMISYINANGPVTVDLGQQRGLAGQAEGDIYISIERATGSAHPDLFLGSDGEDDFRGMGGYDWFVDSPGRDRYDGGSGLDTVSYSRATVAITASLAAGRGGPDFDLFNRIDSLTGSSQADRLTGNEGRNVLRGLYGEDTLIGNGGNDRLEGGASNDYLDGGANYDVALFSGNRRDYSVSTEGDITTVSHLDGGRDGTDTLVNIETLIFVDELIYL